MFSDIKELRLGESGKVLRGPEGSGISNCESSSKGKTLGNRTTRKNVNVNEGEHIQGKREVTSLRLRGCERSLQVLKTRQDLTELWGAYRLRRRDDIRGNQIMNNMRDILIHRAGLEAKIDTKVNCKHGHQLNNQRFRDIQGRQVYSSKKPEPVP
jgi:hypothetical protein